MQSDSQPSCHRRRKQPPEFIPLQPRALPPFIVSGQVKRPAPSEILEPFRDFGGFPSGHPLRCHRRTPVNRSIPLSCDLVGPLARGLDLSLHPPGSTGGHGAVAATGYSATSQVTSHLRWLRASLKGGRAHEFDRVPGRCGRHHWRCAEDAGRLLRSGPVPPASRESGARTLCGRVGKARAGVGLLLKQLVEMSKGVHT